MYTYAGRETEVGPGYTKGVPLVAGVDQSWTGFGLTLMDARRPENYKTWVYRGKGDDDIARLADIHAWFNARLWQNVAQIDRVAMEGYAFASQRAHMAGEIGAVVKLSLHAWGVKPLIVAPTTLKKYVAGKGTGISKAQMLLATYKTFGVEFTDDNAADSYGLAMIACGFSSGKVQDEVLTKLGLTPPV